MSFARLAKLVAVLLVAVALWQMRAPAAPARVAVLALPGAALDLVAPAGELRAGEIRSTSPIPGAAWWRSLFAWDDQPVSRVSLLWEGERSSLRALAVPARLLRPSERSEIVERGFLGSSSGAVVEAADITSGRLPSPYDRAVDAVAAAAANLPRERWSEWISVGPAADGSPSPTAEFQFTHATDSTYFFSPAYVVGDRSVAGTPFLRGLDRDLRPLVATHVIDLARRRVEPARDLFADGASRSAFVFDSAAEDATAVFSPDSTPAAVLERVRDQIAATLVALRELVGAEGLVLVVGGPGTTRQAGATAWYRLVQGGSGGSAPLGAAVAIDLRAARALVRYLSGVVIDEREKSLLPSDVVSRYPVVPTLVAGPAPSSEDAPPAHPWSVDAIESVPGALD